MLELIRRYRAIFSIIFVISAVGMIVSMFGGGSQGMGPSSSLGSDVVARVEGQDIPTRELVSVLGREYERMEPIIQQQIDTAQSPEQAQMIRQIMMSQLNPNQVLQRLVYDRFIYSTALKIGIRSSPEAVSELIREIPEFQKDGNFDPLLYRQLVTRPALFEEDLRKQVARTLLQKSFDTGLRLVSKTEIENQRWLDRKIVFEVVTLTSSSLGTTPVPSAAQIETFKKDADVEARLLAHYNKNIANFKKEAEVRARHILIKPGSTKDIKKIEQDIRDGKVSFEDAAKQYSDDGSAAQGGDLGFFSAEKMVPEFSKAAFGLKAPGDISKPIKSQFGEHIIQLVERKDSSSQTLDQVREEILPKVWQEKERQARLDSLLKEWSARSNGPSEEDLKTYNLKWEKQAAWSPKETYLAALGNVDTHLDSLLRLSKDRPFLEKPIVRGDAWVLVKFVNEEAPKPDAQTKESESGAEALAVAEAKVSTAYEHFFKTRYEEAEKSKKIEIIQDRVAEISKSFQQQQQL